MCDVKVEEHFGIVFRNMEALGKSALHLVRNMGVFCSVDLRSAEQGVARFKILQNRKALRRANLTVYRHVTVLKAGVQQPCVACDMYCNE